MGDKLWTGELTDTEKMGANAEASETMYRLAGLPTAGTNISILQLISYVHCFSFFSVIKQSQTFTTKL